MNEIQKGIEVRLHDKNGVIALVIVAIVVLNIFGTGVEDSGQLLRDIVFVLVGVWGNHMLEGNAKETKNDTSRRIKDDDFDAS